MLGPKRLLRDFERAPRQRLGLRVTAARVQQLGQVGKAPGHGRVCGSQLLLSDCQRAAIKWLGLIVLTLGMEQRRQVVQCLGNIRMFGAQPPFPGRKRPPVQRFGLGVPAQTLQRHRQVVERESGVRMVRAPDRADDGKRAAIERLGLGVPALGVHRSGQIVQALGHVRVSGAVRLLANRERAPLQRFGLGVHALLVQDAGQVVQPGGDGRMFRSQLSFQVVRDFGIQRQEQPVLRGTEELLSRFLEPLRELRHGQRGPAVVERLGQDVSLPVSNVPDIDFLQLTVVVLEQNAMYALHQVGRCVLLERLPHQLLHGPGAGRSIFIDERETAEVRERGQRVAGIELRHQQLEHLVAPEARHRQHLQCLNLRLGQVAQETGEYLGRRVGEAFRLELQPVQPGLDVRVNGQVQIVGQTGTAFHYLIGNRPVFDSAASEELPGVLVGQPADKLLVEAFLPVGIQLRPAQHLPAAHHPEHFGQLRHELSHPFILLVELPFRTLGLGQRLVGVQEQRRPHSPGDEKVPQVRGPEHRQLLGDLRRLEHREVAQLGRAAPRPPVPDHLAALERHTGNLGYHTDQGNVPEHVDRLGKHRARFQQREVLPGHRRLGPGLPPVHGIGDVEAGELHLVLVVQQLAQNEQSRLLVPVSGHAEIQRGRDHPGLGLELPHQLLTQAGLADAADAVKDEDPVPVRLRTGERGTERPDQIIPVDELPTRRRPALAPRVPRPYRHRPHLKAAALSRLNCWLPTRLICPLPRGSQAPGGSVEGVSGPNGRGDSGKS